MMKKIWIFVFALLSTGILVAQESNSESNETPQTEDNGKVIDLGIDFPQPLVQDGAYEKIGVKEKIALGYDHIREADVFWSKRLWRVIDTRQKMNKFFVNNHQSFIEVLMDVIQRNADVELFGDDMFTERVVANDLTQMLGSTDTSQVYDFDTDTYISKVTTNDFNPKAFNQFRLKEDWIFDEETSSMVCRIIGIAPVRDVLDPNTGQIRGQQAMFWMHYPSIRKYLVKYEAHNNENDGVRQTWDDVFESRYFDSYIIQESNAENKRITDTYKGKDALIEGERIKEKLLEKETSLWSY